MGVILLVCTWFLSSRSFTYTCLGFPFPLGAENVLLILVQVSIDALLYQGCPLPDGPLATGRGPGCSSGDGDAVSILFIAEEQIIIKLT